MSTKRILADHFEKTLEKLNSYYIHSGLAEHGNNLGLAREGFIKNYLNDCLPSALEYKTGEIIDKFDNRSGQIDIILYPIFCPKITLFDNINILFSDYVVATIEVKSNLNSQHLKSVLRSIERVKKLHKDISLTANMRKSGIITTNKIQCFILAYKGPKMEKLLESIQDNMNSFSIGLDYLPDLITVIDKEYTVLKNNGWVYPIIDSKVYTSYRGKECLVEMFDYSTKLLSSFISSRMGNFQLSDFFK